MTRRAGFGANEDVKKGLYEQYIGRYVLVYVQGRQETFSGKVNSIKEGHLVLNPFSGGEFDAEKGLTRRLVFENSLIRASDIVAIEPLIEENLRNYLIFNNKKEGIRFKKPNNLISSLRKFLLK